MNRKERVSAETRPKYLSAREVAAVYGVSEDWVRRNKRLRRFTLGRRLVLYEVESIETHFMEHEG